MEILVEQSSPEWHSLRANKIGASDAAVILGIGFKSLDDLYEEKLGKPVVINAAMKRGTHMEPIARKAFEKCMGKEYRPAVFISDESPWMMASLDGISEDGNSILEIKCGSEKLHNLAIAGKLPPYYYSQVQHQMYVTGVQLCYYWSFNGEDGALVLVNRDQGYINNYLPKAKAFWDRLQSLEKPESSYIEIDTQEWGEMVERYKNIQSERKLLDEQEKWVRSELQAMSKDRPCKGYGLTLSKVIRCGNVSYSDIPELKNVDLDKYRKPGSEYWKITLE